MEDKGLIGIVLGIIYILAASLIQNPVYLGLLISFYLVIFGLSKIFGFKFYKTKDVIGEIIKKFTNLKILKKIKRCLEIFLS